MTDDAVAAESIPARSLVAILLCRAIVPLWVLVGAVFKLVEATPTLLPSNILEFSDRLGLDLYLVLALLIGLELFAVAVMVFLGKLARMMAIFMLSSFALILIGEIFAGQSSCGCLGAWSPSPWTMLAIDGTLLALVLLAGPIARFASSASWPFVATAVATIAGFAVSFATLMGDHPEPAPLDPPVNGQAVNGTGGSTVPPINDDPSVNPSPDPLPKYYYVSDEDMQGWVGTPWRDVSLFKLMTRWPTGMDEGRRHVVLYRRSCDHCEEMFYDDLVGELSVPVSVVEIPENKESLRGSYEWVMPGHQAEEVEHLRVGIDWIITPPVVVTVEDGKVICVNQGDHVPCWEMP